MTFQVIKGHSKCVANTSETVMFLTLAGELEREPKKERERER